MFKDIVPPRGWTLARTALFWFVGVKDALLTPEYAGTWHAWLGWVCLVLAIIDTIGIAATVLFARSSSTLHAEASPTHAELDGTQT